MNIIVQIQGLAQRSPWIPFLYSCKIDLEEILINPKQLDLSTKRQNVTKDWRRQDWVLCLVMVRRTHHFLLSLSRNLHKPLLTLLLGIYNFGNVPFTFVLFNETQSHAPTCFFYPYSEKFQTPISFLLCQTCKVTLWIKTQRYFEIEAWNVIFQ